MATGLGALTTAGSGSYLLSLHLPSSALGFSCDSKSQGKNLSVLCAATRLREMWESFTNTSFPDVVLRGEYCFM